MTSVGPDEVLAVLVAFISSEGLAPAGLCWVNCNINVKQIIFNTHQTNQRFLRNIPIIFFIFWGFDS